MFLDEVEISISAGRGGAGSASMRREKFVPRGGPDGGDGGRGGDVVARADPAVGSLQGFQSLSHFRARNGGPGGATRRHGADGQAVELTVPPGTLAWDRETGRLLADLDRPGATAVLATGGRGGRGNTHFATPSHQAPRRRELGEPGETREVRLELRLIADLGIVGLPNAGKSTLLGRLTDAQPKVADYPFTTLSPNLGVLDLDLGRTLTVADVPGLIAGAHRGSGLGLAFLRHLERTRALLHVVDASLAPKELVDAYQEVNSELQQHGGSLPEKPVLVVLNKADLISPSELRQRLGRIRRELGRGTAALAVSAATGAGCDELVARVGELLGSAKAGPVTRPEGGGFRLYRGPKGQSRELAVVRQDDAFVVTGEALERLVAVTDIDDESALLKLQHQLDRMGVERELLKAGAEVGDEVRIGKQSFTFYPDQGPAPAALRD